jgi:hydrogenase maturation protease
VCRVLLIGYGNTLRGDDALGPMAVERLRNELPKAEAIVCHQLAPELAEPITRCELALFVDASTEGDPGAVRVQPISADADHAASLTHHATPAALLALALELYGRAPRAMLITGTGANFESGEGLSDSGRAALDEICRIVPRLVREFSAIE